VPYKTAGRSIHGLTRIVNVLLARVGFLDGHECLAYDMKQPARPRMATQTHAEADEASLPQKDPVNLMM
jgi:hypothetical protein